MDAVSQETLRTLVPWTRDFAVCELLVVRGEQGVLGLYAQLCRARHVCLDMRIDMCIDTCIDMHINMCVDMCVVSSATLGMHYVGGYVCI